MAWYLLTTSTAAHTYSSTSASVTGDLPATPAVNMRISLEKVRRFDACKAEPNMALPKDDTSTLSRSSFFLPLSSVPHSVVNNGAFKPASGA